MNRQEAERWSRTQDRLMSLGIERTDVDALFRIERTLTNWGAAECGDSNNFCSWAIERDEKTEKPYRVVHYYPVGPGPSSKPHRYPIADREKGALKRLATIMAKYPKLRAYHQSDPRGCALYIVPLKELPKGSDISSLYTRGVAVCY